jgi:hypothetical protein
MNVFFNLRVIYLWREERKFRNIKTYGTRRNMKISMVNFLLLIYGVMSLSSLKPWVSIAM